MNDHRIGDGEIDALWRSLHRQVQSRVRHEDVAADVVQEAWLRTLTAPPREHANLKSWLRVVALRLTWEAARARRNRIERERSVARDELVAGVDEEIEAREGKVVRLLEELREPYREVVRLRYLEGLDVAVIARRLGRSEGTIRSQVKRGLDQLRERLIPADGARRKGRPSPLAAFAFWKSGRRGRASSNPAAPRGTWAMLLPTFLVVLGGWVIFCSDAASIEVDPLAEALVSAPREDAPLTAESRRAGVVADPTRTPADAESVRRSRVDALGAVDAPDGVEGLDVSGKVVFRIRGTPIVGATVLVSDESGTRRAASTEGEGRFTARLDRFPAWVWAEHADYAPTFRQRVDRGFAASGGTLVLDSARAGRVSGIVVDSFGRPIEHAEVRACDGIELAVARGPSTLLVIPAPPSFARTDRQGRFSMPTRSNARVRYDVRAQGHHPRTVFADSKPAETRIELEASGSDVSVAAGHTGNVDEPTTSASEPVERAEDALERVRFVQEGSTDGLSCAPASAFLRGHLVRFDRIGAPQLDVRLVSPAIERPLRVQVDEHGEFHAGPLPAGSYEVHVEGGGVHGSWAARNVDLDVGQQLDLGPLTLPVPGALRARIGGAAARSDLFVSTATLEGGGCTTRFHRNVSGTGVEFDREQDVLTIRDVWPGEYELAVQGASVTGASARVRVREDRTTDVAFDVTTAWKTFFRVISPRELHPDETIEVLLRAATGPLAIDSPSKTSRDDAGSVLQFVSGVPDDAVRIEVRSSRGLYGALDLADVPREQGRRVHVRLEDTRSEPDTVSVR